MSSAEPRTAARLLGVDGGGSTTHAWLAEPGCRVLGRGVSGPSNAKAVGLEAAQSSIDVAIRSAFDDAGLPRGAVDVACFGLAGFGRPEDRSIVRQWAENAGWAKCILNANDGDLVVAAGTPHGWGVGVIAGTGSIAVGRTPDGRTARAGGWGHLIGDEGSAYAVVLHALRLVARRADGREASRPGRDPLTERLCAALDTDNVSQIVTKLYAPQFDRARIAALAPEVLAACAAAPEMARRLLVPAGIALAEMVAAVARSLGWLAGELPLAVAGSFLLAAPIVLESMINRLTQHDYQSSVARVSEPVRGALMLAERRLSEYKEGATQSPT
jgi:N-acetylglucosamine kinase-like BadF-type ATPase